ncbi:MAG: glycosyltransferase [Paludibacter sp.]|nr:glycosyltransferase [Paludibacter sp.]
MKKLLIFHPALAPYLIDQFNALNKLFDLEVVFIFDNVWNHKFDQNKLLSQVEFKVSFLLTGIHYNGRVFRFGILKAIKRVNPDIVLGYEYSFTTQYLILLSRLGIIKQKIGSTIDDSIDICYNVQSKARYFARKMSVKRLDYLVVFTNEVSKYYQETFNLKDSQIIVSPILQEPARLRNNSKELNRIAVQYSQNFNLKGKKVLLFVGRFIPEKGLKEFIEKIYKTLLKQDDSVIVFVGDGEEKKFIENFVLENHLENKILLPGRFEGVELYAWYLSASGFVLPSTYEPYGAVVNEALIFGLNVLCSELAGSFKLVGENGMIFNPLNVEDTIDKYTDFMNSLIPLEKTKLEDKPMLMTNNNDFIKEWEKMIYA